MEFAVNRAVTYIFLGVLVAVFAFVLYLFASALVMQERNFQEQSREHERLASRTIEERENALKSARQRVKDLLEDKERVQKQLGEANARLTQLEKNEQGFEALLSRKEQQPDSEKVEKLSKLSISQIAEKLRKAIEKGDRAMTATFIAALEKNHDEAFTYFMKAALSTAENPAKFYNILMLSMLKDPKSLTFFQDILRSEKDPLIRRAAASALYGLPDKSSVPVLVEVLNKDKDWGVKTNAAAALGIIKDTRAIEPLKQAYTKEENETLRNFALASLAKIADPGSVDFLAMVAKTADNADHRLIAVTGLKAVATPEAAAALREVCLKQTGAVAEEAGNALEELSKDKSVSQEKEVSGE
jgi:HEAT repeat protein